LSFGLLDQAGINGKGGKAGGDGAEITFYSDIPVSQQYFWTVGLMKIMAG
jgi:hypothetical protein